MLTFPKGSSKALGRNLFGLAGSKERRVAIIPSWWEREEVGGGELNPVHVTFYKLSLTQLFLTKSVIHVSVIQTPGLQS